MASVLVQVADAIVTEIKAGSYIRSVSPVRSYADWDLPLEDMETLHVDVVPITIRESELASRSHTHYTVVCDVGIRHKFGDESRDERDGRILNKSMDPLVELVEQLHEQLTDPDERRLTDYAAATWFETNILASYYRDMLREAGQFTSVIRLTYEATVSV